MPTIPGIDPMLVRVMAPDALLGEAITLINTQQYDVAIQLLDYIIPRSP